MKKGHGMWRLSQVWLWVGLLGAVLVSDRSFADGKAVRVSDKDDGGHVVLGVGDTLEIRLEVQFGAGFSWRVAAFDRAVLQLTAQEEEHGGAGKPGGVEHQVFTFQALGKGSTTVRLDYVHPWEAGAKPERRYRLCVRVR